MNRVIFYSLLVIFITWCITIGFVIHRGNVIEQQNETIDNLIANNELLINRVKNDYQNKIKLAERIEEYKKMAEQDKNCFTWTTNISNSPIVQRLRQNRN